MEGEIMGAGGGFTILGVVDGSNAPAGFVGELLWFLFGNVTAVEFYAASNHSVPLIGNAPNSTRAGQLVLPPGDYDVSGGIDIYNMAGTFPTTDSYWQVYLGPLRNNFADSDSDIDVAWFLSHENWDRHPEFSMGPIHIRTGVPVTIIMQIQIDLTPPAASVRMGCNGIIRARRVR